MAKATTKPLSDKNRIIIGGIGGIAPLIISLLVVDLNSLISDLAMMDAIGLTVRCLVLIFVGAMVGYLHNSEHEPFKVFQLGIAAPALLTTAINGYSVIGPAATLKEIKGTAYYSESVDRFALSFISSAHAEEPQLRGKFINRNAFKQAKISNVERFMRGLIGKRVSSKGDDWFVITGSHKNYEQALSQIQKINKKKFAGKVYRPNFDSGYFAVAIGANLSLDEAQRLKEKAIRKGLPKDTYLWRR